MNYHDREKDYRAHPGLNQSTLKPYAKGPAYAKWREANPQPTSADMAMGVMVERLWLCPEEPRLALRLHERTDAAKEANKAKRDAGFTLLSEADQQEAAELAALVRKSVDITGFESCQPLYWQEAGEQRKALFDLLDRKNHRALDLKVTSAQLTAKELTRQIELLLWHWQAGWYTDGYKTVSGHVLDYRLVIVSRAEPARVAVIPIAPDDVAMGLAECNAAAAVRRKCIAENHWPEAAVPEFVTTSRWYVPFEGAERKAREVAMDLSALDAMAANIDAGNLPDVGF
jgi:hypothetical protein